MTLAELEAALKRPGVLAAIASALDPKAAKKAAEEEDAKGNETDRTDDPDKDEDDDEDDEDEKKSKKSKKAAATTSANYGKGKSKKSKKMPMSEEDSEESAASSEEDDEESAALTELVRKATGKQGPAAQGALAAILADHKAMRDEVRQLRDERVAERREAVVQSALSSRRITKAEAKTLRAKPQAYVEAFLEARQQPLYASSESELPNPIPPMADANGAPIVPAQLDERLREQLRMAEIASGGKLDTKAVLEDFGARESRRRGANGAPPRE